jgi:hypothetical protein
MMAGITAQKVLDAFVDALDDVLTHTIDADLQYGIGLTLGERLAHRKAKNAFKLFAKYKKLEENRNGQL